MAYREINYSPEALQNRKEYQRRYARARRKTPEGLDRSKSAWAKTNAKLTVEQKRKRSAECTFRHRAKILGICAEAAKEMISRGCQICGKIQRENKRGRRVLVLDHDHASGKFRGILCIGCNTAIGRFKDDPKVVERALRYLLGEQ